MNFTEHAITSCLHCLNASISSQWWRESLHDAGVVGKLYVICFFAALFGSACVSFLYVNTFLQQKVDDTCVSSGVDATAGNNEEKEHVAKFAIAVEKDQQTVLDYMRRFGTPLHFPYHVGAIKRYTRKDLMEVRDESGRFQTIIYVGLDEEDEEAWRPMFVQTSLYETDHSLTVTLSLKALYFNPCEAYITKCIMLENFMQAVCDFRDGTLDQ